MINENEHLSTNYSENAVVLTEMEEFLLTIPDILEVCVVGISIGTGITIPAAVIVRKIGSHARQLDVYNAFAGTKLFYFILVTAAVSTTVQSVKAINIMDWCY